MTVTLTVIGVSTMNAGWNVSVPDGSTAGCWPGANAPGVSFVTVNVTVWLLSFAGPGGGKFYLHPHLTWRYVALIIGLACTGATLAALYPAWKASRMRPIEALSRT